eukprot:gnl/Hemi2/14710_TR4997_c0_g1_i1.p1 gnl/Hemi2/14710_TR4997_c0_g1~~gnl/Hemi2/14710_TR4997_c0_g1_i1.p1  ORF type:complete len:291 (-),score=34.09 gnl/Hemi2/14710_TR4997_c0_g1_i1:109-981(-)
MESNFVCVKKCTDSSANENKENCMNNSNTDAGDSSCTGKSPDDLQLAFKKFRKQRQALRAKQRVLETQQQVLRTDPSAMTALREKFIARAMSYVGVPYAQRYCDPDGPLYNSPLFLDCCGLVRRAMYDLEAEFGFKIGRWNQAYQFDTLPIRLESEKQLKPGDLIFYSATFYDPNTRPQKHGMVHVEIFLGGATGEATLASRWNRGTVQQFDSYKFVSTKYHSITHHFCSIDTWLMGQCTSHCSEHDWKETHWLPGTHSIFNEEDDENAEGAGDDAVPASASSVTTTTQS